MLRMFDPLPFELHLSTRWLGHPLHCLHEVDSTNRLLKEMADGGAGTVLLADHQHAGRGRLGRRWLTPPGSSLLFSLLLRPASLTARHGLLPLVTAVAVAEALESHLALHPTIKWPNDLLFGGRKGAGILSEIEGDRIIVGIGLNVNQEAEGLTELPEATSLRLMMGHLIERGPLLATLLQALEARYDAFEAGWEPHEAWRQRAVLLNKPVWVYPTEGERWQGTALDIAPDGALLVERDGGGQVALHAGDVSLREFA